MKPTSGVEDTSPSVYALMPVQHSARPHCRCGSTSAAAPPRFWRTRTPSAPPPHSTPDRQPPSRPPRAAPARRARLCRPRTLRLGWWRRCWAGRRTCRLRARRRSQVRAPASQRAWRLARPQPLSASAPPLPPP
jgi:hypothetical protein